MTALTENFEDHIPFALQTLTFVYINPFLLYLIFMLLLNNSIYFYINFITYAISTSGSTTELRVFVL